MKANRVWLDGRIVPALRARVSILDPAVQIGSGLFEVTRAYNGVPFLLGRHLQRMRRSARHFGLKLRWSDAAIERGALALLRALRLKDAYVRLVLTEGGTFLIRATPLPKIPAAWYRRGAAIDYAPWRRDPKAPLFGHKTLNYLENVLALAQARRKGLADMLFLGLDGRVLEGCVTNVFLVLDGRLVTPSLDGILPGVTREVVIELVTSLGFLVEERRILPRDLERADGVFLTNALVEALPVALVAGRRIGSDPVIEIVRDCYRRLVEEEMRRNT